MKYRVDYNKNFFYCQILPPVHGAENIFSPTRKICPFQKDFVLLSPSPVQRNTKRILLFTGFQKNPFLLSTGCRGGNMSNTCPRQKSPARFARRSSQAIHGVLNLQHEFPACTHLQKGEPLSRDRVAEAVPQRPTNHFVSGNWGGVPADAIRHLWHQNPPSLQEKIFSLKKFFFFYQQSHRQGTRNRSFFKKYIFFQKRSFLNMISFRIARYMKYNYLIINQPVVECIVD